MVESLVAFGAVTLAVAALSRLTFVPFVESNLHALVGVVFVVGALQGARRAEGPPRRFGFALGGLLADSDDSSDGSGLRGLARDLIRAVPSALREIAIAVGIAAIVLPPFALGFYLWHEPDRAFALSLGKDPLQAALAQLLVVALPEEVFFRGYLQTRLGDAFGKRWLFRDVVSIPAIFLQAALFGAVHVVADFHPARLAVAFPGLLFGVVRAWRGGVGAALVLHALCNVFASFLVRGWL